MIKQFLIGAIASFILLAPGQSVVAQTATSLSDVAQVSLLPGWRTDQGTHMAGLRIELAPGWKTYWRAPGDAGIPPRFDWAGSENLESVQLHWPIPEVFNLNGLQTLAYKGVVVIPLELTPDSLGAGTIQLRGTMEFGVCEEICVPMSVRVEANLPNGGGVDSSIQRSLANRPKSAAAAGIRAAICKVEPISDGLRLTAGIDLPPLGGKEVAVVELPDRSIWISEATTKRVSGHLSATVDMVPPNGQPFALARSDVRISIFGAKGAIDIQGCKAG